MKHSHYFKPVPAGVTHVDVYRVLQMFDVTCPALQHAAKKILVAGGRGAKDTRKDIQEAIDTLQRKLAMLDEDATESVVMDVTGAAPACCGQPHDCSNVGCAKRAQAMGEAPDADGWISVDVSVDGLDIRPLGSRRIEIRSDNTPGDKLFTTWRGQADLLNWSGATHYRLLP